MCDFEYAPRVVAGSSGSLTLVHPWMQDFSRGAPGIPYWGWTAGALAAGGLYYAFTRQQKAEVESAPHCKQPRSQKPCSTVMTKFHRICWLPSS